MRRSIVLGALLILGCEKPPPPATSSTAPAPQPSTSTAPRAAASSSPTPPVVVASVAGSASAASASASASASAAPPAPPPTPVVRTGKVWPFHEYTSAEAVVFNQFGIRPNAPLVAYSDKIGWSPHVAKRQKITPAQMKVATDLVKETKGGVEVSKCAFPRHAIVLFDAENVPVASINVCFQCGDILIWPDWTNPPPDWDKMTDKQRKEMMMAEGSGPKSSRQGESQMPLYKTAFPKWKKLFKDDLGFGPDIEKDWRPTPD